MKAKVSSRRHKAKINITAALLYQLVSGIVGLILPRYILQTFGSDVNGIMQAVSQLLSYTVILECGIGRENIGLRLWRKQWRPQRELCWNFAAAIFR